MTKKVTEAGSISRRRLLTTASAGAVLAVSPFRINLLQAQEAPIKIGFPVPLTGPYGAEAQDQVRAGQLAVAQFNDAGGLNGRKAELVVRDDKLNPGEAATRTLELVEKEKVNFVVGSLSAAVQLAINNVTKERGVIFNSISQSDAINEAADFSKYTFHEALNPHMTSGAVGRYAFTKFGKKVAFLTADYAYGHEMVRGFLEVGKQFNIENLGDIRHPLGTTDFSTLLPRLQALKPDILCISNFGRDQQIALKQATDFGIKKSIQIIAPLLSHASRVAAGPQAFEGVVGGCSFFWGIEDKFASTKAFNDAFRKMYDGKLPTDYGALGYGGVRTVLEAVKGAGSVETDKVVAALEALKYDYYKGPQYYRKCDHQSVQSVLVIKSKSKDMRNESDVFEVLSTEEPDEKNLRSCDALGHKS
ncbi:MULTISPECIES: ABC transporter substrate-binding protein [Bradyrhizobium]|jgi:branched-chain amino acid transport system substrate-binding protein|uniref:ABC transporter substrate-binding protein n=1 Tax=Bradyrhizobium TaxID=374 RepID=UPI000481C80C|nr:MULTISPECIES: ABC transporter substrate-binding protein [Bradyrhizobium]MCS3451075.1 branched-chain amino acid transport system substrate-binding protein [Bradyrhizobium elkanii]MCS3557778.1 branched-chain amino acid transport system substrate-binding protein [Bradyrhizobium elkanii]MCW2152374.1 branched-chain amino acid transport system substrate-binding protein [Bradyrhizobium elkanii]MCW2357749.1 branched-chain amino acid transport system substrate-binding protein [Bradyrhizobium elkanii]